MADDDAPASALVTVEHDGRTFTGRYTVADDVVTVVYARDRRSAPVGTTSAANVARTLMLELVREE